MGALPFKVPIGELIKGRAIVFQKGAIRRGQYQVQRLSGNESGVDYDEEEEY